MATVKAGDIEIVIGADVSDLIDGESKASKAVGRLGTKMRDGVNKAAKYTAAIVATGVAITAHIVNKRMQAIDAEAKFARQLGTTSEALAIVDRAAELSGVSMESLREATIQMNKRLGEAKRGTGMAVEALDRLGVSADEMINLPLNERLELIGERFKSMNVSATEQAVIMAQLGSEQNRFSNLVADGAANLKAAKGEVDSFNTAVTEVEAAQVEAANDAFSSIGQILTSITNKLAVKLAPVIEAVSNMLTANARSTQSFGSTVDAVFENVMSVVGFAADAFRGLQVVIKTIELGGQAMGVAMVSIMSGVVESILSVVQRASEGIRFMIDLANKIPGVNIPTEGIDSFIAKMQGGRDAMAGMREQAQLSLEATATELEELANKPMPSEMINAFFANATEQSRLSAEAIVANRQAQAEAVRAVDEAEMARWEEADEQALAQLRQHMMTEQQILDAQHSERLSILDRALAAEQITREEHNKTTQQLEREHSDALRKIREDSMTELEKFTAKSYGQQVETVNNEMINMTAGVARHSRAMFNVNKAFSIAQAIISAYRGIALTMATYPFPINIGLAAAHGAAAFAQVRAIKGQSFGGSGGVAPSQATTPAQPVANVSGGGSGGGGSSGGGGDGGGGNRSGSVNLDLIGGGTVSREFARGMLDEINKLQMDGMPLLQYGKTG